MRNEPVTHITARDAKRLAGIVEDFRRRSGAAEHGASALYDALDAARIVPSSEIAPDIVTMNSEAEIEHAGSGERQTITLVYPEDADPRIGRVSVLSPLGNAVLGMPAGGEVSVATPTGTRRIRIVRIPFQPEAAGRDDL